jgi:hypothetical protein
MTDAEQQVLDEMEAGIRAVIDGTSEVFKSKMVCPDHVVDFIKELGGEWNRDLEVNGWQWDYWFTVEVEGKTFRVEGRGWYGNFKFEPGDWNE